MSRKVETKKALRVARQNMLSRSCGTCTACCTAKGVKELKKPDGVKCTHLVNGVKGCSIYEGRPSSCVEWSCLWRLGGFEGADRPDRVGVVVDVTEVNHDVWPDGQAFTVREAYPGGIERASTFLQSIAAHSVVVVVRPGRPREVLGPPEKVEQVSKTIQRFLPLVE
jgi:hypothetical protein